MLVNIEAFFLNSVTYAQTMQFLDAIEQGETTDSSPKVDDQYAKALGSEESPAVTVEGTIGRREQACHQGTQNTTHTVYTGSTNRIVNVQFVVDELDGIDQYQTASQSDDDSTNRRYKITTRCNTYQSGQHTVKGQ